MQEKPTTDRDDDPVTWEWLKEYMFEASGLYVDNGIIPEAPRRKADGAELASKLHALIRHFREVQQAFGGLDHGARGSEGLYRSGPYTDCQIMGHSLLQTWIDAFVCTREAEEWFYTTYGPGGDTESLDAIAGPLSGLHGAIDSMISVSVEWEYIDDEDGEVRASLEDLHDLARQLEDDDDGAGTEGDSSGDPEMEPRARKAWDEWTDYVTNADHTGKPLTDDEAHAWLVIHRFETMTLNPESWKRNLRLARKALGQQKNTPRAGRRTGSSVDSESGAGPVNASERERCIKKGIDQMD